MDHSNKNQAYKDSAVLPTEQVEELLKNLPKWKLRKTNIIQAEKVTEIYCISREYLFINHAKAKAFVNAIEIMAKKENHYPRVRLGENFCFVQYPMHQEQGLTENDFICAAQADILVAGPVVTKKEESLIAAARKGEIENVTKLLSEGMIDVNYLTEEQLPAMTALHIAAENGDLSLVKLLLKFKADVNVRTVEVDPEIVGYKRDSGETALHLAVIGGYIDVVEYLLQAKADPEIACVFREEEGFTPVHFASNEPKIIQLLLNSLANIQAKTEDGYTVLHFALERGNVEVVELLLQDMSSKCIDLAEFLDSCISIRLSTDVILKLVKNYFLSFSKPKYKMASIIQLIMHKKS